ncbi:RiPP maturation radical SAM C-methyltransferase [Longimicrobium sp.]|uniref:RiPP maturation radical SAM C-methyltransferase n=1 Tax=Longimicrobium sp. TaxID=2029185 RepID=UPI002E324C6D|nr:RiPP maturation radical SAM C-methyltransferase [Longimicrobium sp.]HEX6040883.1 RiPP maturation radical SAM C-methyltransferase [Longimicrobium sp.]
MYKIALVNMPLANLAMPSLALTQLQAVVSKAFGDQVRADVHYLNHEFAHFLTLPAYGELMSFEHHPTGLGEWFFRGVAFPEQADNAEEYFQRYYPQHSERNRMIKAFALQKRAGLEAHFDAMIDRYGLDQVDMVGFTSMFSQNVAALAMARMVKKRNPDILVVFGGANCESVMGREIASHAPVVDFVFSGPSLRSFPEFVRLRMEGNDEACHRLDGVFSRRNRMQDAACGTGAGAPVQLGGPPAVRSYGSENDVNELVDLDYETFIDTYTRNFPDRGKPILMFETSRGCWWGERAHCTFCGLNGNTINYRSMGTENAFKLYNKLFELSDRVSELQSVDNILPKSYLTDVLPYVDTPENVFFFYEVKADLGEEDFRVLAKARVLRIQPGIEALNTSTLKLMRKGTSVFQNLSFLINAVRYGIEPAWNLLIGFPGEEIEVYEKYERELHLLTHLFPPSGVFPVRFDRFSPYFDEAEQYGLKLKPVDWYGLTYPFPREALDNLAYYFSDHNYGAAYATNAARMVGRLREKVTRWKQLWEGGKHPELRLSERGGVPHVYDSRSGTAIEYPITPDARAVLEGLAMGKKLVNLARELPGVEVEAEVKRLMERGLIFHEGERYMSLIVPPPKPITVPVNATELALAAA